MPIGQGPVPGPVAWMLLAGLAACSGPEERPRTLDGAEPKDVTPAVEVAHESALPHTPEPIVRELFDGTNLEEWQLGVYGEPDDYELQGDGVVIPQTAALAGMTYTGALPEAPYRLVVEATKLYGGDFFLGVTFPVRDAHLTLVVGGWGGVVSGLSSLDGKDAARNATKTVRHFPNGKRHVVAIEVDDARVDVTIDGEPFLGTSLEGVELGMRVEVEPSRPLGIATFATSTLLHRVSVEE